MNAGTVETIREELPVQTLVPRCFACGQDNPSGLKLRFHREGPMTVSTEFTPPRDWTGWGTMMHGGFHGLLLDEIMSWVVFGLMGERSFVTKAMSVKYVRPAYVDRPLKILGRLEEDRGRDIHTAGEIRDDSGEILTLATAVITRIDPGMMKKMI
jgi:acyl-coenzyme A thioesterase PaaI-like protein